MEIKWHGQACFSIKTKDKSIVIDPYEDLGWGIPKLRGDLILVTHDHRDHNNIKAVAKTSEEVNQFVINGPGEYEIGGVFITGISASHDSKGGEERGMTTLYSINADNVTICHLGDLGTQLSNEQLDALDGVDVLLIPVGGTFTIDAGEAVKVVSQIEPRIVIPMHYALPNLKHKLDSVEKFIKELGLAPEETETFKFQVSDLPAEETKLVILKAFCK